MVALQIVFSMMLGIVLAGRSPVPVVATAVAWVLLLVTALWRSQHEEF